VELDFQQFSRLLDEKKRLTRAGVEYWMGRDIMTILAYASWERFEGVVPKAMEAAANGGYDPKDHFHKTAKMVLIGSGAQRERTDWYLTRLACYLLAMNADSSKPEVGLAMTYFAVQTRKQEVLQKEMEQLSEEEKRIQLRLRVMDNNHRLAGAAKDAGVTRYGIFQDAVFRELYGGLSLGEVKTKKDLDANEDLLDNVGRLELSAHDFKATVTEQRLNMGVKTESEAIATHRAVGKEIRQVMVKDGVKPENLAKEPSIKKIVQKRRREINQQRQLKKGKE
jgi:DNA-damage-inducible protein D